MAAHYVRNAETQLGKITEADVRPPETESGQRAIQIPEERLPQSKSTREQQDKYLTLRAAV